MPALVVDAGRLHFLVGLAGEDSPDAGMPSRQTAYDASFFPLHRDHKALCERRGANWSLLEEYVSTLSVDPSNDDDDTQFDTIALITCTIFDDAESEHIRDMADHVFAPESPLRIRYVHFVLQELLILYSSGRTTGLVVNMGHDLTIVGVYEGHMLGETARRVPMTASENVFLASADEWEKAMQLTTLVGSAVMAAPIDTRRDLLSNVIIGGGRWGGWPHLASHLTSRLEGWLAWRLTATAALPSTTAQSYSGLASAIGAKRREHSQAPCGSSPPSAPPLAIEVEGNSSGPSSDHMAYPPKIPTTKPPKVVVIQPPEAGASVWIGGSILASTMRSRVPYLTADAWRARQQEERAADGPNTPPHLLAQDSGPLLQREVWGGWDSSLLPGDRRAWESAARRRASALVHAAPSLCAVLPTELLETVAASLLGQSGWLTSSGLALSPPCARAFLPPPDDTLMKAASTGSAVVDELAALSLESIVVAREDSELAALRRAYAPCVAELRKRGARS